MIIKDVLFHQNNAPAHLPVVAMAPCGFTKNMGLDLVNLMGAQIVRSHSPDSLPSHSLMNALEHFSGETRHLL